MNKRYEYKGMIYCEDDLSNEIDNYGGDLYDLYWSLKESREVDEITYYYVSYEYGDCEYYEDYKELIKEEYEKLGIEVVEDYE